MQERKVPKAIYVKVCAPVKWKWDLFGSLC